VVVAVVAVVMVMVMAAVAVVAVATWLVLPRPLHVPVQQKGSLKTPPEESNRQSSVRAEENLDTH
jgi:hypothetical protein